MEEKRIFGCINYPAGGSGFFSNFFSVLSMIITCHYRNLIPHVNLKRTAFSEGYDLKTGALADAENPWNWWFEQTIPSENDNIIQIAFDTHSNFSHTERVWKRPDIPFSRIIADKYIKIKSNILNWVDEYNNIHFKNHVVLGVMARGSEMNTIHPQYGNQTINTWIESTKAILLEHPEIDKIFLVTENSDYVITYLDKFPDTLYLKDVYRINSENLASAIKSPTFYCVASLRKNHSRLLGEECLTQALLLSKCDYLLVKQCGTSSAAIFYSNDNLKNVYYV